MFRDTVSQSNPDDRENVLVNDLESALSSKRVTCRLPTFISSDPDLWFSLVERTFATLGMREDDEKFTNVTNALDSRVTMQVRDIIVNPRTENAYETLKT